MPNAMQQQANRPMVELGAQKLLRAAYSERQLQEVLTDFWFNHFNVDARKGQVRFMLTEYERDAIRPHVFGTFRDLLEATREEPRDALLSRQLDERSPDRRAGPADAAARSAAAAGAAVQPRRMPLPPTPAPQVNPQRMPRGLNENYGRELMELHTLGVDGGYTQKDVTEVARALTGWTIQNPRMGGGYVFNPRVHDRGEKVVLGHVIKAGGGEEDGEQVLDILATHPSTARFISTKLARRFVSDTPPPALVDRMAATFQRTDGDLREVMRTLLTSPEFLSPDAYRAKVKTPFEFVVSAVRATGTEVQDATPLVRATAAAGHAALHVPAADRLQGHGGRLGEHRRPRQPDELRAAAGRQQSARRAGRRRSSGRSRRNGRSTGSWRERPSACSGPDRRDRAQQRRLRHDARHDREGDHARADAGAHAGLAGISETLRLQISE